MTERDAKTLSKEFEVWTRVPSVIRSEHWSAKRRGATRM